MAEANIEALYHAQIKPLPVPERLRLLAMMAQDLAHLVADVAPELTIEDHLAQANYHGGTLFTTVDEVDAYIRTERDSWEP